MSVTVRTGTPTDAVAVRRTLNAAALQVPDDLDAALTEGRVVVAERETVVGAAVTRPVPTDVAECVARTAASGPSPGDTPRRTAESPALDTESGDSTLDTESERATPDTTGAVSRAAWVTAGTHVAAVAVVRRLRGRGIGSALVERVAARTDGPVTARFGERVEPFYAALGFERVPTDDGLVGWRERE